MKKINILIFLIMILGVGASPIITRAAGDTLTNQILGIKNDFTSDKITTSSSADPNSYLFIKVKPNSSEETYPTDLDEQIGTTFKKITISNPDNPSQNVSFSLNNSESYQLLRAAGAGFMLSPSGTNPPSLAQIFQPPMPSVSLPSVADSDWAWIKAAVEGHKPLGISIERQLTGIQNNTPVPLSNIFNKLTQSQDSLKVQCPIGVDGKNTNCIPEVIAITQSMVNPQSSPLLNPAVSPQLQIPQQSSVPPGGGPAAQPGSPPSGGAPSTGGAAGDPCPTSTAEELQKNFTGVKTAIGCISSDPTTLVNQLIKWVLGFAGGISLLVMIMGAVEMVTSAGNPDRLHGGQERFIAAIIGLIFVVFSVTLMQIIGIDILSIPGFPKR